MSGKNLAIFFISIFILFSVSIKSQVGDSLYYVDPHGFIAREIFSKKIVMLGDGGHHQPAVYHYLLGTLNKWLELCRTKTEEENLTLIIEDEESMSNEINNYIKSGDMQTVVGKILGFNLEDLEYYSNLRKFSLAVDSLNRHREKKISFKVKAFEQAGSINLDRVISLSQREWQLWFVNERDSVTADGIINYINTNPGERILIFYGSGHLYDKRVDKKRIGGLQMVTPEEGQGYFLAYFLNRTFGTENVLKIVPWMGTSYFKKQDFPYPGRKNFIAKSEDLGVSDSLVAGSDYIYNNRFDYLPLIEGGRICSKKILDNNIEGIKYVQPFRPFHVADMNYYRSLNNIYYITGSYLRGDTITEQLKNLSDFNTTDFLYSNRFDSVLSPLNNMIPQIDWFYRNYGVDASKDSIMILLNRFKDMSAMFLMQRAKFTNSIGIYWIGYPDEKIKAKEYLVKFSGEDFAEPEKYLQWYRMKYYGYEY